MPLLRFNLRDIWTEQEIALLLDAAHRAVVEAFGVPEGDRYQLVSTYSAHQQRIEDTGLGIPRSDRVVLVEVTSRPRSQTAKQAFYALLCNQLEAACGVADTDVIICFVENSDADWSFGCGRAQFLTGELG
jgi:hypothetical protein